MILIPESGCAVVKVQGHLGNAGLDGGPLRGSERPAVDWPGARGGWRGLWWFGGLSVRRIRVDISQGGFCET